MVRSDSESVKKIIVIALLVQILDNAGNTTPSAVVPVVMVFGVAIIKFL